MPLVTLEQVCKRYDNGTEALRGVSLTFEPGSITAILGPSGAGKSTMLRCINGLETPTSGQVIVDGMPVDRRNLRLVRSKVGMVFQHFNLVWRLPTMTNVLCGRLARRHPLLSPLHLFTAEDHALAAAALDRVGLADKAWNRADQLSGGQQQRVGIARALVQQPRVILADEPVASLDPKTSREVLDLLVGIARDESLAVLLNLHQVDLARCYADRVVGLRDGLVVFDDSPDALTGNAAAELYGEAA